MLSLLFRSHTSRYLERGGHVSVQSGTTDLPECLRWEFSRWLPQTGTGQQKVNKESLKAKGRQQILTEAPGNRVPMRRFIGTTPRSSTASLGNRQHDRLKVVQSHNRATIGRRCEGVERFYFIALRLQPLLTTSLRCMEAY